MKIIEVIADKGHADTIAGISEHHEVMDFRPGLEGPDGRAVARILVSDQQTQTVLDALHGALGADATARMVLIPVEAVLPAPEVDEAGRVATSREELYQNAEKNARLDSNFLVLVMLSTIVAAIGLIEDNVAVVIGAMVIAPLLGPNIALALGTALGDHALMWNSFRTNLAGLALTLVISVAIAMLWPVDIHSGELVARTNVGMDSVALALASGAAAVLSLTTGLSAILVGVMVAVALLPPAATFGLMLGSGQSSMAVGAGLLLAVNIVCINLSAKLVFLVKGVRPRTWLEKQKARQSMVAYIVIWLITLAILVAAIYWRNPPS